MRERLKEKIAQFYKKPVDMSMCSYTDKNIVGESEKVKVLVLETSYSA